MRVTLSRMIVNDLLLELFYFSLYISSSQPVGLDLFGGSHIKHSAYQIFTLGIITVENYSYKVINNFMVGGNHSIRNCVKALGGLRTNHRFTC